jgi:phosphatidylinositol-3-phosphatase
MTCTIAKRQLRLQPWSIPRESMRCQLTILLLAVTCVSCATRRAPIASVAISAPIARFEHVFIVVEENENYDEVIGNTADMPYLNTLAANYGLATNYYANAHPSLNNYFYLTTGRMGTKAPWVWLLSDEYPGEVAGDNIASLLTANHKTWKAYAESLPRTGYLGDDRGLYVKRHNPFAYFTSVRDSSSVAGQPSQRANIVPFDQFASDLRSDTLPDYSFIAPNLYDDGHNDAVTKSMAACGDHRALQQADKWLKNNMAPLVGSASFQRDGVLIIVFDEACETGPKADSIYDPKRRDLRGGGHVAAVVVSSLTPAGTRTDQLFHHESVLRLSLTALGIEQMPGFAASAPDMNAFFKPKTP